MSSVSDMEPIRLRAASHFNCGNLVAIMDYNNLQGYGRPAEICALEPIRDKWASFGWSVLEVDGHDLCALKNAIGCHNHNKPKIVIAKTTKGKGVSFMEDQLIWHYYIVTDEHKKQCLEELVCETHS